MRRCLHVTLAGETVCSVLVAEEPLGRNELEV